MTRGIRGTFFSSLALPRLAACEATGMTPASSRKSTIRSWRAEVASPTARRLTAARGVALPSACRPCTPACCVTSRRPRKIGRDARANRRSLFSPRFCAFRHPWLLSTLDAGARSDTAIYIIGGWKELYIWSPRGIIIEIVYRESTSYIRSRINKTGERELITLRSAI